MKCVMCNKTILDETKHPTLFDIGSFCNQCEPKIVDIVDNLCWYLEELGGVHCWLGDDNKIVTNAGDWYDLDNLLNDIEDKIESACEAKHLFQQLSKLLH